ncbi:hypothetical protein [Paenibacillus sp. AGC30]
MTEKDSVKKRFLSEISGAVEDWNKHISEDITNVKVRTRYEEILDEQEQHGNSTNYGLGRDLWYSNEYFIHCQIKDLISYAEDDDVLYEELRKVWVGVTDKRNPNAMAMNVDGEFEGYLITMNIGMDIDLHLVSLIVSQYLWSMEIDDKSERAKLATEMMDLFLCLIDDDYFLEHIDNFLNESHSDIDLASRRMEIGSQLFEGGMKFVLGHEIGHHILSHTASDGRNIVSKFKPDSLTYNALQLDEFAADNFGFDLLVRSMKKEINVYFLFAPLMVILLLAMRDKCPEQSSPEHPSLRDRYLNLLSKVSEVNEGIANKFQEILNEIASWIRDYYNELGHWKTEWWKG